MSKATRTSPDTSIRAAEVGDSLTVYDLEGNTIDTFTIAGPGEVSEDQLAQIAQMER